MGYELMNDLDCAGTKWESTTGYHGIYTDWNVDMDGNNVADDPWDFGAGSEYPLLKNIDANGDGVIDAADLAKQQEGALVSSATVPEVAFQMDSIFFRWRTRSVAN